MAVPTLIVVGGSAGGLEAVRELVQGLSPHLPAAVCIVVHIAPSGPGLLPLILNRVSPLPAAHVNDCERLERGRVYVAAPNCHLVVRDGTVISREGPRENGFRPAIDPLFRSAAAAYGDRTIGVILSGAMDDGVAGLAAIEAMGGRTVVQNPSTAAVRGLPDSAIRNVSVDHVVDIADMATLLNGLVAERSTLVKPLESTTERESPMPNTAGAPEELSQPTATQDITLFRCPDCKGPMRQAGDPSLLQYRCHEGHVYTAGTLMAKQGEQLAATLRESASALREQVALGTRVAHHSRARGDEDFANFVLARVERAKARLAALVQMLGDAEQDSELEMG